MEQPFNPSELEDSFIGKITPDENVNWNVVKFIVEGYYKRHQFEMAGCIEYIKNLRKDSTEFGQSSEQTQMRHLYELPKNLEKALTLKYPKVLKAENLKTFLSKYPEFQVPEKL